jgi:hypothetical protein
VRDQKESTRRKFRKLFKTTGGDCSPTDLKYTKTIKEFYKGRVQETKERDEENLSY